MAGKPRWFPTGSCYLYHQDIRFMAPKDVVDEGLSMLPPTKTCARPPQRDGRGAWPLSSCRCFGDGDDRLLDEARGELDLSDDLRPVLPWPPEARDGRRAFRD